MRVTGGLFSWITALICVHSWIWVRHGYSLF